MISQVELTIVLAAQDEASATINHVEESAARLAATMATLGAISDQIDASAPERLSRVMVDWRDAFLAWIESKDRQNP